MSSTPRPHDLVWLNNAAALEAIEESWVAQHWRISLPVVVRRDVDANARIPVGVRGMKRDQRAAGWVQRENIVRTVSPETLADRQQLLRSPFVSQPPVQAAISLTLHSWYVALGHYRQHRLRAYHRDSGTSRRQRSRSANPRAAADRSRSAARLAVPRRAAALPGGYPGRNARRGFRAK